MMRVRSVVGIALCASLSSSLSVSVPPAQAQPAQTQTAAPPAVQPDAQAQPAQAEPATAQVTPASAQPADAAARVDELAVEGVPFVQGGLTADQAAERALAASASVREKRAQIEVANAKIRQTMLQFFPQLTLRASYMRYSPTRTSFADGALVGARSVGPLSVGPGDCGSPNCVRDANGDTVGAAALDIRSLEDNYEVGARLTVPLSDYVFRVTDAAASSDATRDAARYAVEAEELRVQSETRVLYYNWLRAHAQSHVAQKALERARARLADAESAFSVGTLSQADRMRVQALVANAELALHDAETLRTLTSVQLQIMMDDPKGGYEVGQGLPEVQTKPMDLAAGQALLKQALARRIELRVIDASEIAYARGGEAQYAGAYPRLDAVGDLLVGNPNPRYFPPERAWQGTWMVGLQATWNITDVFGATARGDELEVSAQGVHASRRGVEAAITAEVAGAHLDVGRAQAGLVAGQTTVLAAEENNRVTTDLFRVGRATTSDLLEAESELLAARIRIVNARIDLTIALQRLAHATGDDVKLAKR
jgi:outer membrane protein